MCMIGVIGIGDGFAHLVKALVHEVTQGAWFHGHKHPHGLILKARAITYGTLNRNDVKTVASEWMVLVGSDSISGELLYAVRTAHAILNAPRLAAGHSHNHSLHQMCVAILGNGFMDFLG